MYYLKEYDFKKEPTFPRMVLYGDELVVTSSTVKGLFICNTATLKCRYAAVTGNDTLNFKGVLSVCLLKNKILAYGPNAWYNYTTKDGMKLLKNVAPLFKRELSERAALQPNPFGDTAFIFSNAEGILYGIALQGNNLRIVFKRQVTASINSISILNNIVWVNTKLGSFTLHGNDILKDCNITAMIYDKQGNKWISSLTKGLLAQYKTFNWKMVKIKQVPSNDAVYYIKRAGNSFLMSTRNGRLVSTNNAIIENGGNVCAMPNGLRIMGERANELKGSLFVNSTPGEGTEIKLMCRLS